MDPPGAAGGGGAADGSGASKRPGKQKSADLSQDVLIGLLEPFVGSCTWITYGDKLDSKKILKLKKFWQKAYELAPSLLFKDSDLKKALVSIFRDSSAKWSSGLPEGESMESWAKESARRVRKQASHINAGMARPSRPDWCSTLWSSGVDDLLAAASESAVVVVKSDIQEQTEQHRGQAQEEQSDSLEVLEPIIRPKEEMTADQQRAYDQASMYFYAYCREKECCYRVLVSNLTGPRDYSDGFWFLDSGNYIRQVHISSCKNQNTNIINTKIKYILKFHTGP